MHYHPMVSFLFFMGAILTSICISHPIFILISIFTSIVCMVQLKEQIDGKFIVELFIVALMIGILNALFNTRGKIVLFTYFHRPFTFEAFLYGIDTGGMFLTVLFWFTSLQMVITNDRLCYIMKGYFPTLTFLFQMILHLIPKSERNFRKIEHERKCIGMVLEDTKRNRFLATREIVSAVVSQTFENGMITSDSMKSRGYGEGKRSSFLIFSWNKEDIICLIVLTGLLCGVFFCRLKGGLTYSYDTWKSMSQNRYTVLGLICALIYCGIPEMIYVWEEIKWNSLC